MLAPILWLKDYVDNIPEDIKEFGRMMTLTGTMVESVEYRGDALNNIVTARVDKIERHPDSDHMWVCELNDGENVYTIVTGAQNVKQNDIVPLARNNSVVAGGKKIKESNLRGIKSSGMLCSGAELGLNASVIPKHQEDGIYILDKDTPLGVDIKQILGLEDNVVEFELTNNRQDCNSILGIAAEASATLGKRFCYPEYEYDDGSNEIDKYLKISVENYELCKRYTARMVKIKKIEQSPLWMQIRLMGVGIRPINNVVDVSNFVMLETGQPLHTFDYNKLEGGEITVKTAEKGSKFVTLDGIERELEGDTLMINDAKKPVAIAGIMGGGNSDIDEDTKLVVIESANFNKVNIRRSSKSLGLRSESSAHFEKGLSVYLTKYAADRAASLLVEIGAAELVGGVIDKHGVLDEPKEIDFDVNWFNKFIGINITVDEAGDYLERLNFNVKKDSSDTLKVTPFRFREDIEIKEDVAEEAVRLYGYDKIPLTMMESSNYISNTNKNYLFKQKIKRILIDIGGNETLTYSFISPDALDKMCFEDDDARSKHLTVRNPLGVDNSVMRTSLIPNIAEVLKTNLNKKNKPALMFEIGNLYLPKENDTELPIEKETLVLGKYNTDFYDLKSVLVYIFNILNIDGIKFVKASETYLHPGRSAYVMKDNKRLGVIGQLHPTVCKNFELNDSIYVAELDFALLSEEAAKKTDVLYKPIPKYPAIERDIALVCDNDIEAGALRDVIFKYGGKHLIHCEVFDVYKSDAIGAGKKSVAFNLLFRSDNATLTDESIDKAMNKIIKGLEIDLGATLR